MRVKRHFGVAKQVGRLNVNLAFLLFYTDPFDWKNTEQFNKRLLLEQEGAHFCSLWPGRGSHGLAAARPRLLRFALWVGIKMKCLWLVCRASGI